MRCEPLGRCAVGLLSSPVAAVARQAPEDLLDEVGIAGELLDSPRPVGIGGALERSGDPALPLVAAQARKQQQPEPLEIV